MKSKGRDMRNIRFVLTTLILITGCVLGGEISYNENFALADDRETALSELIPGTQDYYYYNALNLELKGDLKGSKKMIDAGVKKYKHSALLRELENRYALKMYEKDPEYSRKYIINRLNLHFNHQQKKLKPEVRLPTTLDQNIISFDTLAKRPFSDKRNTDDFESSAFDYLMTTRLTSDQRRSLLSRLWRPDYPGIVKLIVDDLNYKHSKGFGHHQVHRMLTIEQLEECLKRKPELIKQTNFINTYLAKLRPNADVNWRADDEEYAAYLKRLLTFTERLPHAYLSLKANVIFRQLEFNMRKGVYDRDLFNIYVKMPRSVPYINPDWLRRSEFRNSRVSMKASYEEYILLPPINIDEKVVRRHLEHFLKNADNFKEYSDYIEHNYLKRLFAMVKLVNGIGDAERWYAMMDSPSMVKTLRDRIDIELLPVNRRYLDLNDEVSLNVAIKNVKELTIKVYDINTTAYYRRNLSEITTAIELDGLVPNSGRTVRYKRPPMRRHVEKLSIPEIREAGVYVVELIGNGVSSRAVVRKGNLTFAERIGAAGHVFTVYDDSGNQIRDAALWMAGTEYRAEDGEINVPFSGDPGRRTIVLTHNGFSVLREFNHLGENYKLCAGMHLGREQLRVGGKCTVTVRPELLLNGEPVNVSLIESPTLTIRSFDQEGLSAEKQVNNFKIYDEKESTYTFRVPGRLRSLDISLNGKVQNLNTGEKVTLSVQKRIAVNQIVETEKTEDLFLRRVDSGYIVELLGRNAEARTARAVRLELKHRDFRRVVHVSLKTDEKGRVYLGALRDIVWVKVRDSENTTHTWQIPCDMVSRVPVLHMLAGGKLRIPVMQDIDKPESDKEPLRRIASLLEIRDGIFVKDYLDHVKLDGGYLVISDLPPGDYNLMTKPDERETLISVTAGRAEGGQLLGKNRVLEKKAVFPLQIEKVEIKADELMVRVANAVPGTRVHVAMTRYVTDNIFKDFGVPVFRFPSAMRLKRPESQYLSARRIGDEYRYVMERRKAGIFPGNMLTRPSLILNPWSPRSTDTGTERAAGGEKYDQYDSDGDRLYSPAAACMMKVKADSDHFSCFDFLKGASPIVVNLKPDANGVVRLPMKELPVGQHLHIYAVNDDSAVYRQLALAERGEMPRDLRLKRYLPVDQHFTEQKRVSIVRKGESFKVADILSTEIEVVDSVSTAYRLLTALNDDPLLAEFNFIVNWFDHSDAEKRKLYREHACHELHLFLAMKDPAFFTKVVRPCLVCKKDKTFIDDWLLGNPLEGYLEPWANSRLNMAERALLAQRMKGRHGTARHMKDMYDLLPPDNGRLNRLFDSALRSGGLEEPESSMSMSMSMEGKINMPGSSVHDCLDKSKSQRKYAAVVGASLADTKKLKEEYETVANQLFRANARKRDENKRIKARQLYRKLEKTKEWVENNYYQKPLQEQTFDLVKIDAFWRDYANWNGEGGFLSDAISEAGDSFTEIMFALAVLDLPFKTGEHDFEYSDGGMVFTATDDVIIFHKQVQPAKGNILKPVLLINQSFFARDDRYRYVDNERFDKFVTKEFEKGRVYGCQLVLTNPTSTRRKVDILQQIPSGAIPVLNGMRTKSRHVMMEPYSTLSQEYFFYFPVAGEFPHYPAHVAQNGEVAAAAKPFVFKVVAEVNEIDKGSWAHISQFGTKENVINYLNTHNIERLNLEMIAWRMRDKAFFGKILDMLQNRRVYNNTLWSYSLHHNVCGRIHEYLPHTPLAKKCGKYLRSPLLDIDPIVWHIYEHKEYWPLVNARVFKLGGHRKIMNSSFFRQYEEFMKVLTYRSKLTDADEMAVTIYMLLQDRIKEALRHYKTIDPAKLKMRLQYDYLSAYMAFYQEQPDKAGEIAAKYKDYPVDRWRVLFGEVLSQCAEIRGERGGIVDAENRTQTQTKLADTAPGLRFDIEGSILKIDHANINACVINYFPMDLELLFSRKPFEQDVGGQFTVIKPNQSDFVKLNSNKVTERKIPSALRNQNLVIEVAGAGISRLKTYYPNALKVDIIESYGHLRVADKRTGKALSKVYVKVYSRTGDGQVKFHKDGYTDLRGRFDYTSLNTDEIDSVSKFAILIMSGGNGAVVREARPPKR